MSLPTPQLPILILGSGISGLLLARSFHQNSIPFRLFDRLPNRTSFSQGHRFRISSTAYTSLQTLLSPSPLHLSLLNQTSAQKAKFKPRYVSASLLDFSRGIEDREEGGARPIDRSWLLSLLSLGIEERVEWGKEFVSYSHLPTAKDGEEAIEVKFADGTTAVGCLVIGADGIKSLVRTQLQPERRMLDLQRWVMWGRVPLTASLREEIETSGNGDVMSWFMALDEERNVQCVVEPMIWSPTRLEAGEMLPQFKDYIYFAVATTPLGEKVPKSTDEKRSFLMGASKEWHPALRLLFKNANYEASACIPVLSSKPDIEVTTSASRKDWMITLVGDSAHGISPMGGAGAELAIFNATDLADTIAQKGVTRESIQGFEKRMEERAKQKIEYSFENGKKFWKGGEWYEYPEVHT
ncbi:FAD/NAD(P)-binding domain-containing protein [Hyaloscypha variabilis F]|uniref:FAD/NAD(P)-binding domain-containing protein n=1 Tax=Hyaloscypha variabilis (strain UAMH 11265 / GT02V1 / F) TaxID=1149755 RepID=A0A2J6S7L5_HYAVF|nr:FAD/NAD(P)-binding domain-containing protein [Hyaloscypha variabilis F]